MLPAMVRPRHVRTAVASDCGFPQALGPGGQALGGPDVVEEFRGREVGVGLERGEQVGGHHAQEGQPTGRVNSAEPIRG